MMPMVPTQEHKETIINSCLMIGAKFTKAYGTKNKKPMITLKRLQQ